MIPVVQVSLLLLAQGCGRAPWATLHSSFHALHHQVFPPGLHSCQESQGSTGMSLLEVSKFGLLPLYLLACSIRAGLFWMGELLDNRLLKFPLHHFGISSPSRRACLTVALLCVMKYNGQSPNILQQTGFTFCSMLYESCAILMW